MMRFSWLNLSDCVVKIKSGSSQGDTFKYTLHPNVVRVILICQFLVILKLKFQVLHIEEGKMFGENTPVKFRRPLSSWQSACKRNCNFDVWLTVHRSSMWIKRPTRCQF